MRIPFELPIRLAVVPVAFARAFVSAVASRLHVSDSPDLIDLRQHQVDITEAATTPDLRVLGNPSNQ